MNADASTLPGDQIPDARPPATIDGKTLSVLPTPPRIDLSTIRDVRRELASVYRAMKEGKIEEQKGSKLAFVLGQIGQMIKTHEVEQRIEALERVTNSRRTK